MVGDAVSEGFGVVRAVDVNYTDAEMAGRAGHLFSNEEIPGKPVLLCSGWVADVMSECGCPR